MYPFYDGYFHHDFDAFFHHTITMISYAPLWKTLKKKGITQYQLINMGVDRKTMDSLRHNRNITVLTIEKLCYLLDCEPNDILEFVPNESYE